MFPCSLFQTIKDFLYLVTRESALRESVNNNEAAKPVLSALLELCYARTNGDWKGPSGK